MGALVAVTPPAGVEASDLSWIITIGPFGGGADWEPLVCGPYERPHALALARALVAQADLMAVVEPLRPCGSIDQIDAELRRSMTAARHLTAADPSPPHGTMDESYPEAIDLDDPRSDLADSAVQVVESDDSPAHQPPNSAELREGFLRIANRLRALGGEPS